METTKDDQNTLKNNSNQIKAVIQNILDKMGVLGEVDVIINSEGDQFIIKTRDAGILIGDNGKHLAALNYMVRKIAEKNIFTKDSTEEDRHIFIDVNDYQRQRIEALKEMAKMSAQRVRYFNKEVVLRPMNAYNRRIIHSALTEYPDIVTESMGEGEDRRVVIKPYNG